MVALMLLLLVGAAYRGNVDISALDPDNFHRNLLHVHGDRRVGMTSFHGHKHRQASTTVGTLYAGPGLESCTCRQQSLHPICAHQPTNTTTSDPMQYSNRKTNQRTHLPCIWEADNRFERDDPTSEWADHRRHKIRNASNRVNATKLQTPKLVFAYRYTPPPNRSGVTGFKGSKLKLSHARCTCVMVSAAHASSCVRSP